jgi:AcrR family transcriptional regulator
MTGSVQRRERRRVATRRAIQSAAVRLAIETGFAGLTVEAISEAADVSSRTFFNYFRSKEEVFRYPVPPWTLEEFEIAVRDRPDDERPAEALRAVFLLFAADLEARRTDIALWRELAQRYPDQFAAGERGSDPQVARALANALGARCGAPDRDLTAAVIASAACAAFDAAAREWTVGEGRSDLRSLVAQAFDVLANGSPLGQHHRHEQRPSTAPVGRSAASPAPNDVATTAKAAERH